MKLQLMKILVVLELTKTHTKIDLMILIVSKEIGRYKEILWILRILITGYGESLFLHLGYLV